MQTHNYIWVEFKTFGGVGNLDMKMWLSYGTYEANDYLAQFLQNSQYSVKVHTLCKGAVQTAQDEPYRGLNPGLSAYRYDAVMTEPYDRYYVPKSGRNHGGSMRHEHAIVRKSNRGLILSNRISQGEKKT